MKKTLILYDSVYGNTKKVAMSLCRGLEAGYVYVDCISIQNFDIKELVNYDLIGIGGSTHFHGASKQMKLFLSKIKHLRLENKYGFAFETKTNSRLAGSAAKSIIKYLKKMEVKIIHSTITSVVFDKEGALEDSTSIVMEKIGLTISNKLNNEIQQDEINQAFKEVKQSDARLNLNRLKLLLFGGGSLFFFIRAIHMASTGGDSFGTINPSISWFFLLSEIIIAGLAGITGLISVILLIKANNIKYLLERLRVPKIVLFAGFGAYIVHFIRVTIWILLFVI